MSLPGEYGPVPATARACQGQQELRHSYRRWNYGEGSSREHVLMSASSRCTYHSCKIIPARIHRTNLKNKACSCPSNKRKITIKCRKMIPSTLQILAASLRSATHVDCKCSTMLMVIWSHHVPNHTYNEQQIGVVQSRRCIQYHSQKIPA